MLKYKNWQETGDNNNYKNNINHNLSPINRKWNYIMKFHIYLINNKLKNQIQIEKSILKSKNIKKVKKAILVLNIYLLFINYMNYMNYNINNFHK